MARIASLNVLLTTSGKDYLSEQYGAVVENISKNTISSALKNMDLSGTPGAGTYEAKRFVNRTSNAYGTARSGGKGQAVKASAVVVSVDTDKELITEVEAKDVTLYGVDNFIERQSAMDEKSMARELERAFFDTANTAASSITFGEGLTIVQKAEKAIQAVETVQNNYVDGVERDMISLVCSPSFYGELRTYMDDVEGDGKSEGFGMFHGVRVYSSVYLPAGVNVIAMADGAVAQPVLPTVAEPERIQLSNAIAFGLFYSYGTKAVSPDLIFSDKA